RQPAGDDDAAAGARDGRPGRGAGAAHRHGRRARVRPGRRRSRGEPVMTHRSRSLSVAALARVEGEGAMRVTVDGDRVSAVELNIYEPPRFFEAFLRGRGHT